MIHSTSNVGRSMFFFSKYIFPQITSIED